MAAGNGDASDIIALMRRYASEDDCVALLEKLRWPDGPECCRCGSRSAYKLRMRREYQCGYCQHQFSVTSGTILHRTRLPLIKWIIAAALICNARKGISAKQLARDIGVTYKVAWSLGHRLRHAMQQGQRHSRPFCGVVEVDESYVGGKSVGGKRGRGAANKVIVFGAKERRSGHVRARVIPNVKRQTIRAAVHHFVDTDARLLIADAFSGYNPLQNEYELARISHKKSYTRGGVHTQGIESTWAVLKRQYHGTHHWVSPAYMPLYLAEIVFKMNNRGPRMHERVLRDGLRR